MTIDPTSLRLRFLSILGVAPLAGCFFGPTSEGESCIQLADGDTTCPSQHEASERLVGDNCGYSILSVDGEGERRTNEQDTGFGGDRCCYPVTKQETDNGCVVGRPYYDAGRIVVAEAATAAGWSSGRRPDVRGLTADERRVLADAWTRDALIEHASVAAFSRFASELLAFGAPAGLVDGAHRAARDEIRHARLAFALASTYAGRRVSPAGFPFPGHVPLTADLATLAAATTREGAVGETIVALLAVEALQTATDPAVRHVLDVIARDEARHAELAWRSVRWMIAAGGRPVSAAVQAVFHDVAARGVTPPEVTFGASESVLAAHGRIRPAAVDRMVRRAMVEVVTPCGAALAA